MLALICGAAALFVASWRIGRRFGWAGQAVLILLLAAHSAVRDRIWWDTFMRVSVATPGILPILADGALMALGLVLGHAVVRLVAGPARNDSLARIQ